VLELTVITPTETALGASLLVLAVSFAFGESQDGFLVEVSDL
jgi:hypothetical protein